MTTEGPATPVAGSGVRVEGLGLASVAVTAVGVVLALLALLVGGSGAATGAAAGALLVVSFFTFGAFSVNLVATVAPRASMLFALMTYTLQVLLLAVVLVAVNRSDVAPGTFDARWLGGTVIVGTLVWMGALLVGTLRAGTPGETTHAVGVTR
ncbi:hypothetical protein G7072_12845 [Nocardioides sp. HDW12B]|uniref:hypothetical protein n=1 Tax=Nocardioides sp. HDW12B TaxID=2714939 RepID=UPI00140BDFC3|nr:hypothetical protein [Nocardioides sp. HDW12B]QIK67113.1 hypothetical protein G7072_12845 [Nocardioides sp. HDW12B]